MNKEKLIDFKNSLIDIHGNYNAKDNHVGWKLVFVSFVYTMVVGLCVFLWNVDHKALQEPLGFFTFMGRLVLPVASLCIIPAILMYFTSEFKEKFKFKKRDTAFKKVSGSNIENYFNDLYLLFNMDGSRNDLEQLEKIVNTLAVGDNIDSYTLNNFNTTLENKIINLQNLEKSKVNYFREYKRKLDSQMLKNTDEENIKFFEKT